MTLRPFIITAAIACAFSASAAHTTEAQTVRQAIDKVNTHWQATHNPEHNAFWDEAAYHTGNMEAYKLTGKPEFLEYSLKWAEHNDWKGAKGTDRSKWKYNYGEDDDHVLFGDWQICFQTYADLYNMLPDDRRIRRAREVMEYEMSTPQNDYWWWADGLYMVMPVMTKLHNITGNKKYLDKLYEYILKSDSIMYDNETGLYFRDGKYIYPKHKSVNGKKDFWARGDGWVLAGLAKVLADVPADWKHRPFFSSPKDTGPAQWLIRNMLPDRRLRVPLSSHTVFSGVSITASSKIPNTSRPRSKAGIISTRPLCRKTARLVMCSL